MPRSRHLFALVPAPSDHRTAERLTRSLLAALTPLTFGPRAVEAQSRAASETPLHVPTSRFEFVASGDTQPPTKPLAVHNGGTARLTNVRLTRIAYADSARGAS